METKTYSTRSASTLALAPCGAAPVAAPAVTEFGFASTWAAPVQGISMPAPARRPRSVHGMNVATISAAANAAKGADRAVATQVATGEAFEDPV
jgi:hypothetical protein